MPSRSKMARAKWTGATPVAVIRSPSVTTGWSTNRSPPAYPVSARYSAALLVCARSSSSPSRARPYVAPQIAATGTPAARKARAAARKPAIESWSHGDDRVAAWLALPRVAADVRGGVSDLPVGEGVEHCDVDRCCTHDSILSYRQHAVNRDFLPCG